MTKDRKPPSTPARIEWALGFLSAAAVLAIAGYLGFEAAGSDTLPDLKAEILPAAPGEGPGQLRFVVRNDGGLSGYRWGVERKRDLLKRESQA